MSDPKRQAALTAVLTEPGIDLDVHDSDARLQMQKAIYLVQSAGVHLGYSFNWYIRGPYSPKLADDYYETFGERSFKRWLASPALKDALQGVKKAIEQVPAGSTKTQWMEALASVDFINRVMRKSGKEAKEKFDTDKPRLAGLYGSALAVSKSLGR